MNKMSKMSLALVQEELNINEMAETQAGGIGKIIGCGCLGAAAEIASAPLTWFACMAIGELTFAGCMLI